MIEIKNIGEEYLHLRIAYISQTIYQKKCFNLNEYANSINESFLLLTTNPYSQMNELSDRFVYIIKLRVKQEQLIQINKKIIAF